MNGIERARKLTVCVTKTKLGHYRLTDILDKAPGHTGRCYAGAFINVMLRLLTFRDGKDPFESAARSGYVLAEAIRNEIRPENILTRRLDND